MTLFAQLTGWRGWLFFFALISLWSEQARSQNDQGRPTLLFTGYSHLDTQWLWTYRQSLATYLPLTVTETIRDLDVYPEYSFNFTGSFRYRLLEAHFPKLFGMVQDAVAKGRWFPAGSSVDESDLLVPSHESVLRHVLYSNNYFNDRFGTHTSDFLAPDAFGFRAHLPTTLVHAGVVGFTTQKLEWGLSIPKPFDFGVWEGADGSKLLSSFSPGLYSADIPQKPHENADWRDRVFRQLKSFGLPYDMRFLGAGDSGGSPGPENIGKVVDSIRYLSESARRNPAPPQVSSLDWGLEIAASDAIFQRTRSNTSIKTENFASHLGPLLLTEHSAGTLTSNAWSKKWNRSGEDLGSQAERAAIQASLNGLMDYPHNELAMGWELLLASQMHDILPGTSVPDAYLLSHQDQFIAGQIFGQVLARSVTRMMAARPAPRAAPGGAEWRVRVLQTFAVYNPLPQHRHETVEMVWQNSTHGMGLPGRGKVGDGPFCFVDDRGDPVLHQIVPGFGDAPPVLLLDAQVEALSVAAYHLVAGSCPDGGAQTVNLPRTDARAVQLRHPHSAAEQKEAAEEWIAATGRLELQSEHPHKFPAWNMDWSDRRRPPAVAEGPVRVQESFWGPLVAGWVLRSEVGGSRVDRRLLFDPRRQLWMLDLFINWRESGFSLKMKTPFPSGSGIEVFADGGLFDERTPVNTQKLYEFPTYRWVARRHRHPVHDVLTGLSFILNRETYGFDRPSDRSVRHTLLHSPQTRRGGKHYHATQDYGRHSFSFAFGSAQGDLGKMPVWQQADAFSMPLIAFEMREPSFGNPDLRGADQMVPLDFGSGLQLSAFKGIRQATGTSMGDRPGVQALLRFVNRGQQDVRVDPDRIVRRLLRAIAASGQVLTSSWVKPCSGAEQIVDASAQTTTVAPSGLLSLCFAVPKVHSKFKAVGSQRVETQVAAAADSVKLALEGRKVSLLADEERRYSGDCEMDRASGCFRAGDFRVPGALSGTLVPSDLESALALKEGGAPLDVGRFSEKGWLELVVTPEAGGRYVFDVASTDNEGNEVSQSHSVSLPGWDALLARPDERIWDQKAVVAGISPGYVRLDPSVEIAWMGTSRLLPSATRWVTHSLLEPTVDPYHRSFVYRIWLPVPAGRVRVHLSSITDQPPRNVYVASASARYPVKLRPALPKLMNDPPAVRRTPWAGLEWLRGSAPEDEWVRLERRSGGTQPATISAVHRPLTVEDLSKWVDRNSAPGLRVSAESEHTPHLTMAGACDGLPSPKPTDRVTISPASRFDNEIQKSMDTPAPKNISSCFAFDRPVRRAFVQSGPCRVHQGLFPAGGRLFGALRVWTNQGIFETDIDGFRLAPGGNKIIEVNSATSGVLISRVCVYPVNDKDGFAALGAIGEAVDGTN